MVIDGVSTNRELDCVVKFEEVSVVIGVSGTVRIWGDCTGIWFDVDEGLVFGVLLNRVLQKLLIEDSKSFIDFNMASERL